MRPRDAVISLLSVSVLATTLATSAASADIAGPDDSIQQAFGPLQSGTWYSGGFTSAGDVDYLAFSVPQANTPVHVDVENTVGTCASPYLNGCPVWGTLIDGQGTQVGGEGSAAGTGEVDAGANDVIDWTFTTPGTYYLALDSAGDLPTYRVREITTPPSASGSGGSSTPSGGSSTTGQPGAGGRPGMGSVGSAPGSLASLVVKSSQRGYAVHARLVLHRAVRRLRLSLDGPGGTLASERLSSVPAGRRSVALRLDPAGRRALARSGHLDLTLRLTVQSATGRRLSLARTVTLVRPASH